MHAVESNARDIKRLFAPHELASMQSVIDAVCSELGVTERERNRRKAVAERVMNAYRKGARLPLNMVSAGLSENKVARLSR